MAEALVLDTVVPVEIIHIYSGVELLRSTKVTAAATCEDIMSSSVPVTQVVSDSRPQV